jgi:hypothetical protein
MQRSIPPLRILLTDCAVSLGGIIPLAIWCVTIAGLRFDLDIYSFALPIAPTVAVAGLALTFWRVWSIRTILSNGTSVPGAISSAAFFRGATASDSPTPTSARDTAAASGSSRPRLPRYWYRASRSQYPPDLSFRIHPELAKATQLCFSRWFPRKITM